MWANEQEAAALSGFSPATFREVVITLEKQGFPQKNRLNGLRYIPAIDRYWACQVEFGAVPTQDNDEEGPDGLEVENFHGCQRR